MAIHMYVPDGVCIKTDRDPWSPSVTLLPSQGLGPQIFVS